jgi:hypothetical protein
MLEGIGLVNQARKELKHTSSTLSSNFGFVTICWKSGAASSASIVRLYLEDSCHQCVVKLKIKPHHVVLNGFKPLGSK